MSEPRPVKNLLIEQIGKHHYKATVGRRHVGSAVAWRDWAGHFVILNVVVHPCWRRRGIATALYSRIETDAGVQLAPTDSTSDEAFEFWKSYRPDAVRDDLRHRRLELLGSQVTKAGRQATITAVGSRVVTARYNDATERTNSETCIHASRLSEALVLA